MGQLLEALRLHRPLPVAGQPRDYGEVFADEVGRLAPLAKPMTPAEMVAALRGSAPHYPHMTYATIVVPDFSLTERVEVGFTMLMPRDATITPAVELAEIWVEQVLVRGADVACLFDAKDQECGCVGVALRKHLVAEAVAVADEVTR